MGRKGHPEMPELGGADDPVGLFHDRLAVRENQKHQDQENAYDHYQLYESEGISQSTPTSSKRHAVRRKSH
jgi:hypothetical protein